MSLGLPSSTFIKNKSGPAFSSGGGGGADPFASLQMSASSNAGGAVNAHANIPGINQVQMPDWLSLDPNDNMDELLDSYAKIPAAFDPTGQVKARNDAIGYNTSAGGQAANNAATEFSNRAAQSGASQLGAGVVKAQALMPVLAQNAALKTDAADIAAKSHQEGATLAAQIAGTIGQLRTNYLNTLTGYAQGQQGLALDTYKAEQAVAGDAANRTLQEKQMAQQKSDAARLAATTLLAQQKPLGTYNTDNSGRITSGQSYYDQLQNWQGNQASATSALRGMF